MRKKLILSLFTISFISAVAQPIVFSGCPGNNLAVLRAGINSSANPVNIYDVSITTGAVTFRNGPILDPANTTTYLQVNGLGLNATDGFLYGINASVTSNLTINTRLPFYRIGQNTVAVQTGNMPGPLLAATETQSIVNPATVQ